MTKKFIIVLLIAAIVTGNMFAQEAERAKNIVTIDTAPFFLGVFFRNLAEVNQIDSFGFGIGAQYERQLQERVSAAFRFAYLGFGYGTGYGSNIDMNVSCFSFEGHVRHYFRKFFLNGMLGFALMTTDFSGRRDYFSDSFSGNSNVEPISFSASRGYVKVGIKLGWRIIFGNNNKGGFTFEPSFGYYAGYGLGNSFGRQVRDKAGSLAADIDSTYSMLANYIFVGGPRLSLAFGYSF